MRLIFLIASHITILVLSSFSFAGTNPQINYATVSDSTLTLQGNNLDSIGPLDVEIDDIFLECTQNPTEIVCSLPELPEGTWTVRIFTKLSDKKEKEAKIGEIDVYIRVGGGAVAPCIPGDFVSCYEGDPGTLGLGECKAGTRTCSDTGEWGDCLGQRLPDELGSCCLEGLDECPGRCVDLQADMGNCGSCGYSCHANSPPNAMCKSCIGGSCNYTCRDGFGDCNNDMADGCEVNTRSDNNNCGYCKNVCESGSTCIDGKCGVLPK